MDAGIQKALHDKFYERRKLGALELEKLIRESLNANNHDRIRRIVDQLCQDYAYAVHQPYARNGGLIGLAAASIALGPEVARYLEKIIPPVLACFSDQDARVRYYACESMYNIAKTSKGEMLPFFNEIFDALAKLAADAELSVKNGAELLDRLIKDIISDSATSYISILYETQENREDQHSLERKTTGPPAEPPTAFSLSRFIPLLQERILVLNPFTRMFLVSWITLLDSIPDLELVTYLPSFLGGLFRFLNDSNQDVVTATQHVLERFLEEIKLVARVKRQMVDSRKNNAFEGLESPIRGARNADEDDDTSLKRHVTRDTLDTEPNTDDGTDVDSDTSSLDRNVHASAQDDWVPGQDVHVDHPKILEILVTFLRDASEENIQLTALRWIDSFFEICPEDILTFVPRLLNEVLPALSSDIEQVRQAGNRVNSSLMEYIISLNDDEEGKTDEPPSVRPETPATADGSNKPVSNSAEQRDLSSLSKNSKVLANIDPIISIATPPRVVSIAPQSPIESNADTSGRAASLDYEAAVNALTLQFLNENEATRVAALSWLIMLQRKAPRKVLAAHDVTFPALLKTLSDTSDTVVTRDLQLLSQISKNSDDTYFTSFMVNLLNLFCTDRRLLETRGNLIIRQLCVNLSPERIYRIMADCLEKDEDVEFASIMVQNLNNNLITAPELADLRKKLRNWETRDGQTLFVALFRSWCHNAVATISLCLLAQAYEQAYNLLQIFADIEMTVNTLIQIDKLVQLLESPVFTYLRLQLLEPERYPYLYKVLYGILMLLPQSAAFAALKNRLNSVSAIGYLHIPSSATTRGTGVNSGGSSSTTGGASVNVPPAFERANRLKQPTRDEGTTVKWTELLDKFRTTQDRARRSGGGGRTPGTLGDGHENEGLGQGQRKLLPAAEMHGRHGRTATGGGGSASAGSGGTQQGHRSKFSTSSLGMGRFASGVKARAKK